jgi:hypothetical protein
MTPPMVLHRRRSLAWAASCVILPIALALPAAGLESRLAIRFATLSEEELTAELATTEDALMRFEIAREMARRGAGRFTHLWESRLTAAEFTDRCAAGLVLALSGDDRGLERVLTELAEATAQVQDLMEGGPRSKMDRLEPWQRSHHQQYLAALTLGEIGDPRAVGPLIEATRDPAVAYRAALSLGEIGDPRAIPALREMARRIPPQRHWAGWALARFGEPDGFDLLIEVAAGSDLVWSQRRHAIVALGELAYRGAVEPLSALLADGDVHLRVAAARALGEIGDPAALPALRAALEDGERTTQNEEVTVGEVAAKAIRQIEEGGGKER